MYEIVLCKIFIGMNICFIWETPTWAKLVLPTWWFIESKFQGKIWNKEKLKRGNWPYSICERNIVFGTWSDNKTPQMKTENDNIYSWCFHAKELFINSRHLKYFLSGHSLIFHDLMNLLLEQGIPTKYKEIWVIPNSNCD